tara:strand:- start:7795 stop:9114 length:1320 start_codon:yes stop_codon:yes gene_type:complete
MNFRKSLLALSLAASTAAVSHSAYASAFQIWEQSAGDMGNYHAGSESNADSAATEFYNVAGMTNLKHPELSIGVENIQPNFKFSGSTQLHVGPVNFPKLDGSGIQGGGPNIVPNIHYVQPLGDRWAFGFGISVPFGLTTNYPGQSIVADAATDTAIKTIDFTPGIAFQVTKVFSIGAGMDLEYATGEFDQYVLQDSITNSISSFAVGYHLGALWRFDDNHTKVGISYHSRINQHADGTSTAHQRSLSGVQTHSSTVSTYIPTPAYTALSVSQDLGSRWTVMGAVNYTQWNALKNITLNNISAYNMADPTIINPTFVPVNVDVTLPQNFKNTWNVALGANYKITKTWMLRMGMGFDESPVNNHDRNLQLPDNDHYVIAVGAQYTANKNFTFNVGYNHIFMPRSSINYDGQLGIPGDHVNVNGHVDGSANLFGAQVDWKFA